MNRAASKKGKYFIAGLCIFFFLISNNIDIDGGWCTSSPCSPLTSYKSNEWATKDYAVNSNSNIILSPTALFIYPVLKVANAYEVRNYFWHLSFDRKDEVEEETMDIKDSHSLLFASVLIKLIVILSFPWWVFIGWLLYKLHNKYPLLTKLFVTLFVLALIYISVPYFIFDDALGDSYTHDGWDLFKVFLGSLPT